MKLVFFSVVLNHHQAPVADELYNILGDEYCFVELVNLGDTKGATEDYSKRPYLLRAWESSGNYDKAMELACTAECCVFAGNDALPLEKERMKLGLLSFDMGERWLKQGIKSFVSPRLWQWLQAYYFGKWKYKPLYKLCCSAFCACDHYKFDTFKGKCYKWGYFTEIHSEVPGFKFHDSGKSNKTLSKKENNIGCAIRLMWCARFIDWKHPEMPIRLATKLKDAGYDYHLDMYGDGVMRLGMERLTTELNIADCVTFHGNIPNSEIHQAMRDHDIFLFTSDRREGWGAVANEAMSEGCVLVGSNEIGSVPYLVKHKETGMIFRSCDLDSLYEQVKYLLDNPDMRKQISKAGRESMVKLWSPANAVKSLLQLIEDIQAGHETSIIEGPCSKA